MFVLIFILHFNQNDDDSDSESDSESGWSVPQLAESIEKMNVESQQDEDSKDDLESKADDGGVCMRLRELVEYCKKNKIMINYRLVQLMEYIKH